MKSDKGRSISVMKTRAKQLAIVVAAVLALVLLLWWQLARLPSIKAADEAVQPATGSTILMQGSGFMHGV